MGSLSVQPPSGMVRNITEVFMFLRNNAQQSKITVGDLGSNDDKLGLIAFDEERQTVTSYNRSPPSWVNVLDEVNYELTRIKTRMSALKSLEQKHLTGNLDFSDENSSQDQEKIKELTDEITGMFTHCRRLIRLLEESESDRVQSYNKLRQNVIASLMLTLNNFLHDFRANQSSYLKHLDSRVSNIDNFLVTSSGATSAHEAFATTEISLNDDEELTIDQIQQIMENEHLTKEREKEVIKISKSILELNTIFKDVASLILDQGTILDRIDYNVEQSVMRIKSAYKSVEKAEKYQRGNKKMKLIMVLAGIAIFLTLLILLTKF